MKTSELRENIEEFKNKIIKREKFANNIFTTLCVIIILLFVLLVLLSFHAKFVMDANGMKSWVGASIEIMVVSSIVLCILYFFLAINLNHRKNVYNRYLDDEENIEAIDEENDNELEEDSKKQETEDLHVWYKTQRNIEYSATITDSEFVFTSKKKLKL